MIPDTPSSAASGMGEYELASASVRPEIGSVEAAVVPMSEHVERFWRYLETETVRILVDMRREMDNGCVYYDSSSLSDDVAKALVADRKSAADALSAKDRELAALDDELAGERWHADEAARQRDVWKDRATSAERALDEALSALREKEERVKALEEALEPFAEKAGAYDGIPEPKYFGVTDFEHSYRPETRVIVTLRDLRRARSVLTPVSREQRGEEA